MDRTGIQLDIRDDIEQSALIEALTEILGPKGLLTAPEDCARYASDQSGLCGVTPLAVLRPAGTDEVAALLALCNERRIGVVPQGGRTGLSGGACSPQGTVVLSTERMSGVTEIDPDAMTLTAWAGTPLETVQEAARAEGLDYAVDIGARGSATIGGTIATNAGGIRVLQHGMTRANVLGLEAVLADGSVISRLGKTVKDNAGFDLKQVFIGSEGTLGVVTRAVLELRRQVVQTALALFALPDHAAALACLSAARQRFGARLSAFEGMWPDYWDFVCHETSLAAAPLEGRHGIYLLIEIEVDGQHGETELEDFFAELFEGGVVEDGVLAKSLGEMRALWQVREAVGQVDDDFGPHINFDIGVSPSALGRFCEAADVRLTEVPEAVGVLKVGHVGDGNVHLLVAHDGSNTAEARIEAAIYDLVREWGGAVTAEHGIGRIKGRWIGHSRSPAEVAMMRGMKLQLDPNGILNPGALFVETKP
ncbi:FAD-binding oxidoreductase [Rhodovulum sulfidophilum]|uniref:FAD-binding oxidoreductase n=1 Tax=Rhodovulum sulfidophilum TaxID=35806 RepID=UPI00069725A3|nr:FAD-binding oxidoreductase [Rhodovulum sulfidophilum]ANB33913.1 oxidoreductase [Rhodovulum sulfidophilum DSM 1374]ANB37735.1 oxidoreductase [Rhodovulum sulfidophilum]MBK5925751.1 FAD-binding oxidoreductase [Rhodovulum sulfidophilum]MCW2304311.1 FAD/FMN-containing dehydrogenase [Rhodovulum sulfidophilum]